MPAEYRHNHFVPAWYQKRFVPSGQVDQTLFYLDLKPKPIIDPTGISHVRTNPSRKSVRACFAENDMYTARIAGMDNTEIEKHFFGKIDTNGRKAVEWMTNFAHPWNGEQYFQDLMLYMSTQKLRTPKGLAWLADQLGTTRKDSTLHAMLRLQQLYSTIWAECVWLVADASQSVTKFIVSDHPVTVYNRRCGPHSMWCRDNNDPDIRYHGSHTIFPLSSEKILILTNLSWVRNPYQRETNLRPNPTFYHETILSILDIQTLRHLSEQEVREINFIVKSRARRYVAAGKKEWLYPEGHVRKSSWHSYGEGYLLMPDPRSVRFGGETVAQFKDGSVAAVDEFGRQPWDDSYSGKRKSAQPDWESFKRFQGEFATKFGPNRRGRAYTWMRLDNERDDEKFHLYHLNLFPKNRRAARRTK
jgi:uncharacterized protein DUF4238